MRTCNQESRQIKPTQMSSLYFGAIALFILFTTINHNSAHASPWPREPGSIFVSVGIDQFQAEGDFVFDLLPLTDSTLDQFQRFQTRSYFEYGITRKWLASFKTAYAFTTTTSPNSITLSNGLTEYEGTLQRQIWKSKRSVLSLAIAGGQNNSFSGGTVAGLNSDGIDGELRVLYGRGFTALPFASFITAELAYRRRFGTPADQIRGDFKIGVEPHNRVLLLFDTYTVTSLRNNAEDGLDFDVVKIQPSLALRVYKGWRIQGGVNYEIAGRNIDLGRSYFINLWSKF